MVAIRGRFDGAVFVPDEAVDLPRNQRVILHVEPVPTSSPEQLRNDLPPGTPGRELLKFIGMISPEDLKAMSDAIEEGCEQVDPDEW